MYRGLRTGTRTARTIAEDKGVDAGGFPEQPALNSGAPEADAGSGTYREQPPAVGSPLANTAEKSPFANVRRKGR